MDFDKPKVYGDTFISDGLVDIHLIFCCCFICLSASFGLFIMCLPHFLTGYNHIDTQVGFIYEQSLEEKQVDIDEYTKEEKERQGLCGSELHMNSLEVIFLPSSVPMICIFQGACNSDGSRVVDWGGLIIMFLGVALTGARVLFDGSSLKRDFQILICHFS